ncbi:MAG: CRTAC1 family protein [Xanthomonadales bacterium]|nr:CRTAC1 family protein [Xanthomonadales bacterium]
MRRATFGALILVYLVSCERVPPPPSGLIDVTAASGITRSTWSGGKNKHHIRESLGQGACWIDYDRDGDSDLLVLNGGHEVRASYAGSENLLNAWQFYINQDGKFKDATKQVGLHLRAWGLGCAVGDIDQDGFADLFVTTAVGPNRLFRNRGDGRFEDWTSRSGVGSDLLSTSAAFGDLDNDGDLDLVVATYLDESSYDAKGELCKWKGMQVMCGPKGYRALDDLLYLNDGYGRFQQSKALAGYPGYGLGVVLFDADGDGDSDIFIANDSSPNHLFLNQGSGQFIESGLASGTALSHTGASQAGMGVDVNDLDGDGLLDIVVTNFSDDIHNFYHADGRGYFSEWSNRSGLAVASFSKLGWSVLLEDFDLDGDVDVFTTNGHVYPQVDAQDVNTTYLQAIQLLFNDGKGNLHEDIDKLGMIANVPMAGRGAAAADFDGDGDMDVVVVRDGEPPLLLRNDIPTNETHWIKIRLAGQRSNKEGIGARVELEASGVLQVREMRRSRGYLSGGEAILLFGLGSSTQVERLTVHWPGGDQQVLTNLEVDREWKITETAEE